LIGFIRFGKTDFIFATKGGNKGLLRKSW